MSRKEPKFEKGDYIISHFSGDMAIVDKVDKKNYYHFKVYFGSMFDEFKDVKKYTLQVNYDKFFEKMTDDEIKSFDDKMKKIK